MEKMKKIKNMCELEKYVGEMAHKKLMFCKGFYLSTGVPFYDDYFGCKPCAECKECKRYLYRRQYMNLFYAVAIVFGILMMLILGTPQGAIRWNLFFHSVVVNGEQQEWEVICLQTTCIARRLSE